MKKPGEFQAVVVALGILKATVEIFRRISFEKRRNYKNMNIEDDTIESAT